MASIANRNPLNSREMINRRLPIVVGFLVVVSGVLLLALARYQWLSPEVEREFKLRGAANVSSVRRLPAERGLIFDRDGQPLAFNAIQYEIGVSPNLVTDARQLATQMALILGTDEFLLYQRITQRVPWVQIARPVPAEIGEQLTDLRNIAITIDPLTDRFYPQGNLAGPLIGFVIEDNNNTRGALGVEASYNDQLAGRVLNQQVSRIPFDLPTGERSLRRGMNLVLTIDRDIQFWVEEELRRLMEEQSAPSGSIIVMDPRNGDILAMVSLPTFDPNDFVNAPERLLRNPAIGSIYEPGSVFKVLTLAAGIERGGVTPQWTYNDTGLIEVGGIRVQNWDRNAYGLQDATQVLVNSLNVGVTTMALEMGRDNFYSVIRAFGIGQPTRIDLPGEEAGILKVDDWSESDLATNSFGQGVSVTPLQMITAVAAIANDGLMMQPRIVRQVIDGDQVINAQPSALGRPISAATANMVTDMMVRVVEDGATLARISGYTVAGKTGTAQIPIATGYEPGQSIASFVGFLPADDPQVVILVKLDRPRDFWGSQVAAPAFRRLAERLVILLGIPTDDVRRTLAAQGGSASR